MAVNSVNQFNAVPDQGRLEICRADRGWRCRRGRHRNAATTHMQCHVPPVPLQRVTAGVATSRAGRAGPRHIRRRPHRPEDSRRFATAVRCHWHKPRGEPCRMKRIRGSSVSTAQSQAGVARSRPNRHAGRNAVNESGRPPERALRMARTTGMDGLGERATSPPDVHQACQGVSGIPRAGSHRSPGRVPRNVDRHCVRRGVLS